MAASSSERKEQAVALHRLGHTTAEIAAQLGVDRSTVSRYLQPGPSKISSAERARLEDECRHLRRLGYKQKDIAARLGIGQSTVSNYLKGEPPSRIMASPAGEPPSPELVSAYHRSVTLSLLGSVERELREINAEHCFAGDVADAREAEDTAWLESAGMVLEAAQAYLDRLHAVLADQRAQSREAHRRDDVALIDQYRRRAVGGARAVP